MKRILTILILFGAFILAACGSASGDYESRVTMSAPAGAEDSIVWHSSGIQLFSESALGLGLTIESPAPRMLIQRAEVDLESEDFDISMNSLRNLSASFGGYTESSNISSSNIFAGDEWITLRNFNIVMRIPVADFEEALRIVESYGTVTWLSQSTEDVTDQFMDVSRRMYSRQIEEDRILALVEHAANLEELFLLESRLTQIRTQIEIYRGSLENLGNRAALSTISVSLREVRDIHENIMQVTFWQRIGSTFTSSIDVSFTILQGIAFFIAAVIFPLTIFGLIALAGFLGIRYLLRFIPKSAKNKKRVHADGKNTTSAPDTEIDSESHEE